MSVTILALMVAIVAGCGGGDDQSGDKQDNGGGEEKKGPEVKIALGTVQSINPESKGFAIKPSQGGDKMVFSLKKARITLDGEEAEVEDIERKQQAQVKYVTGEGKVNRARAVELFGAEEETTGMEGESTG